MRSGRPKVLHEIAGRSLLGHALAAARGLDPARAGRGRAARARRRRRAPRRRSPPTSSSPSRTRSGAPAARPSAASPRSATGSRDGGRHLRRRPAADAGDAARPRRAARGRRRRGHGADGARCADPTGYGRVLRDADGAVVAIVEQKDATPEQAAVTEINTGIYAFDGDVPRRRPRAARHGQRGRRGLPHRRGGGRPLRRARRRAPSSSTTRRRPRGSTTACSWPALGRVLRDRIVEGWMRAGVTVVDPATTWLDAGGRAGRGRDAAPRHAPARGDPGRGRGDRSVRTPRCATASSAPGASVVRSHATGAEIGAGATVGPYSYLRPGTVLGDGGEDRRVRRDQERRHRGRLEGAAPVVRR